jgi:hypothetical protein
MHLITSCSHIKSTTVWLYQVLKHSFKTFLKTLLHVSDRPLVHLQGVYRNVRDRSWPYVCTWPMSGGKTDAHTTSQPMPPDIGHVHTYG